MGQAEPMRTLFHKRRAITLNRGEGRGPFVPPLSKEDLFLPCSGRRLRSDRIFQRRFWPLRPDLCADPDRSYPLSSPHTGSAPENDRATSSSPGPEKPSGGVDQSTRQFPSIVFASSGRFQSSVPTASAPTSALWHSRSREDRRGRIFG